MAVPVSLLLILRVGFAAVVVAVVVVVVVRSYLLDTNDFP